MKTSDQTDKIYFGLFGVQQSLPTLKRDKAVEIKTDTGKFQFRFTPLDTIVETIKPLFKREELTLIQTVDIETITTRIAHVSGQWIESTTHLNKQQPNMRAFGAEVSYKRRYALSAILGIVTDDDVDAPRISATKGILETLSEDRRSVVIDSAEYIKDQIDENDWGAYETYVSFHDDERMALWSLLPSKCRSTLTKMHKTENDKQRTTAK